MLTRWFASSCIIYTYTTQAIKSRQQFACFFCVCLSQSKIIITILKLSAIFVNGNGTQANRFRHGVSASCKLYRDVVYLCFYTSDGVPCSVSPLDLGVGHLTLRSTAMRGITNSPHAGVLPREPLTQRRPQIKRRRPLKMVIHTTQSCPYMNEGSTTNRSRL